MSTSTQLLERLRAAGTPRVISGHGALALNAADTCWLVSEGFVEVFAIRRDTRSRTHVSTVDAGNLLFGPHLQSSTLAFGLADAKRERNFELAAVGVRQARLIEIPLSTLRELVRDPELVPAVAGLIEGWLNRLFEHLLEEIPPTDFRGLRGGEEVELEAPALAARPDKGLLWVRHLEGSSAFLGRDTLKMGPAGYLLPLTQRTWLVSQEPTRLSCVATPALIKGGAIWESLARFHDLFADFVERTLDRARDWDRDRLQRRDEIDLANLDAAFGELASAVRDEPAELSRAAAGSALFTACQLVASRLGIRLIDPGPAERGTQRLRDLDQICAASRIRNRKVILRDAWWRRDNGPLIALKYAKSKDLPPEPVALLPTATSGYVMVDPSDGSRRRVDSGAALGLMGIAFMLYRPLPERALRLRDLLQLAFRDARHDLKTILGVGIAGGALSLLVPLLTAQIIGRIIPSADRSQLVEVTAALILAALASAALEATRGIAMLRLSGKIDGVMQAAIWDRLLRLPTTFFRQFTVGDLANRSLGFDRIRETLTGGVVGAILASLFSVFSLVLLFIYSVKLAWVALALMAVLAGVTAFLMWLQLRHQRELLELAGQIASLVFGFLRGVAKLRTSGSEHRAFALWAERFAAQRRLSVRARNVSSVQVVFGAVFALLSAMALFAMVILGLEERMPLPEFMGFFAAFGQLQTAVLALVEVLAGMMNLLPLYERLSPILETPPEVDEHKLVPKQLAGDIEVNQVTFRYSKDSAPTLDGVSFRARPGEFIALVGPSGSGKSTCLRLLLGFEKPEAGSIYFDGLDQQSLDIQSIRRQIGVVLQSGKPMSGDIFTNIVGSSDLTMDDAWAAARLAGLEDDIKSMPMQMHTVVSEGAGTFSGGQRQRLMIARAIVHRPRILLLDEATSALDNRTQEIVSKSLEGLKATRIVVAHRLSTIVNADRIYVIERGRVLEEGGYAELVARGGLFAQLVARQSL